jgi:hypothetical protein
VPVSSALPRIGVIATLRQDVAQTLAFVHYHLHAGVDHIALYFDDPHDPAVAALKEYSAVVCRPCTPWYWHQVLGRDPQRMAEKIETNFRSGFKLLRGLGMDWVSCIDADELLYAPRGLANCLADVPAGTDVVHVPPFEAVHVDGDDPARVFSARYFKVLPGPAGRGPVTRWLAREIDGLTRDRFFGHREGKCFVATGADIDMFNHHKPRHSSRPVQRVTAADIMLLHFDSLSPANWREKWQRRISGSTRAVNLSDHRRRQQELIAAALADGSGEAMLSLYRRWFCLDPWRARLQARAGLLVRVELPEAWFRAAPGAGP